MSKNDIGDALGKVAKKSKTMNDLENGISDYLKSELKIRDFIISVDESSGKKKKDKYSDTTKCLVSFREKNTKNPIEFTSVELIVGNEKVVYA
jgi:hypothetical protein